MNEPLKNWVEKTEKKWIVNAMVEKTIKILEVGSLNINGGVRDLFPFPNEFTGIDLQKGEGVDIQMNAHDLTWRFGSEVFDIVICLDTLEHDDAFWVTIKNIREVLRTRGLLFLSVPAFTFPIHRHPKDYWRFGEDAFREVLLKGFKILEFEEIFTKENKVNPEFAALAQKL